MTIKVLIADDHPIVRSGIRSELARYQDICIVGEAIDGDDVLALVKQVLPDIVILDIIMPGKKAIYILQILKSQYPDVSVLIFSAYGDKENVAGMLRGGARGYMLKDADPNEIIKGIRAIYSGNTWLDNTVIHTLIDQKEQAKPIQDISLLSVRELEVLQLMGDGMNNEDIAQILSISESTIKNHVTSIYGKLGFSHRAEAVAWVWKNRIIQSI